MIRFLLLVLLFLPVLGQAQSQRQLADRRVRGTEVRTVDERKGERSTRVVNTTYDRKGNATEIIERDLQGRLLKWERHVFDHKGNETLTSTLDSSGAELERTETTWDRWGNQTCTSNVARGRVVERTTITCDKYGEKEQELVTDGDGKQVRRTVYAYEGRGLIKQRTVYDAKDRVVYDRTYSYTY